MESIRKFVKFYKSTSTFGTTRIDDMESPNNEILNITNDEFINDLYVSVPMEAYLEEKLVDDTLGKLIAVCGPAGSGKSSVSVKVKNSLTRKNYLIIFLDFKIEFATEHNDDNYESIDEGRIRSLILNSFLKEFPILLSEEFSKRDEFMYFLLSPEVEILNQKTDQIYLDFRPLQEQIATLYKRYNHKRKIDYKTWYKENYLNPEISGIIDEALKIVNVSHYVHYIVYQKIYDKVIIWIDNIDSFANIQQQKIAGFLHRLERSILNLCQIVISVREENIYRYGPFNEKYSEPFTSTVSFSDPDKMDITSYGAVNIPVITTIDIKKIIKKKISYCRKQFYYRYPDTVITENLFSDLEKLSLKICDCFDSERIIFLANNSIREYLSIHSKFLFYLISTTSDLYLNKLPDNELKNWQLVTKFLSWIYTVNEPFRLESFNVLEEANKFDNNTSGATGCFLPYLILTRIWNECVKLTGQHSPFNNPYLQEIIDEVMADFGFLESDILATVYNLLHRNFGQGNFITIRNKKKVEKYSEIRSLDTTVRITYRGKTTIGSIINSYGYFLECVRRVELDDDNSKLDNGEMLFEKLQELCDIHLTSLKKIKEQNYKNTENWFVLYLKKYGLPLERPFVRHEELGVKLNANKISRRALYLECLLSSLMSYFNWHDKSLYERTVEINTKFHKNLKQLTNA